MRRYGTTRQRSATLRKGVDEPKLPSQGSRLEQRLHKQLKASDLPEPVREYRFSQESSDPAIQKRRWRFDFAWPEYKIAVEVDGAVFSGGRHTRGAGFVKDAEKKNIATIMGWRILTVINITIKSGQALEWIYQMFDRIIQEREEAAASAAQEEAA